MSQQKVYFDGRDFRSNRKMESVNPKRMYVSASASLPSGEADAFTKIPDEGLAGYGYFGAASRAAKVKRVTVLQRLRLPHQLSFRAAFLAVAALAFVLGIAFLSQEGMISEQQKLLNRNRREIEACMSNIDLLTAQIAEKSDEAAICYRASRELGLIRSDAAEAIYLTAVSSRPADQETADRELDTVAAKAAFNESLPEGQ